MQGRCARVAGEMCKGCRGDLLGLLGRCAKVAGEMCKGCRGDVQGLPGRCAKVAGEMCKGCRGDVQTCENKVNSFSVQLKVEIGLQVREEFDNT